QGHGRSHPVVRRGRPAPRPVALRSGASRRLDLGRWRPLDHELAELGPEHTVLGAAGALGDGPADRPRLQDRRDAHWPPGAGHGRRYSGWQIRRPPVTHAERFRTWWRFV